MRLSIVFLLLATACVPKAKYEAALAKNNELHGKVERLEARLAADRQAYEDILADLKPLIDRGVLKVENKEGRVVIGMASDVLFASGSTELSADGKANVAEVARLLARRGKDHMFQVEGHTDNVPIATAPIPDNWHLGALRALTVTEFMIAEGFPRTHLSAATFGDTRPVGNNENEAGRAQNRRIEIVVLPDLEDLGKSRSTPDRPRTTPRRPKQ